MAKQVQRGLGKGLSALMNADLGSETFRSPVQYVNPARSGRPAREGEVNLISISNIEPNPYQPRVTFDADALEELASSIRELGLIQPITVRKLSPDRYQIISGERRFRACRLAGMNSIPAYVRETDDAGMLAMAIVENVQRENLDPIETAMSYQRLIEECHLTQEKMAERIGKNRVTVTNFLRLLRLPAKVQYDIKTGRISVGHSKALLSLDDAELQEKLSDRVIREDLSVRALEKIVRELQNGGKASRAAGGEEVEPSTVCKEAVNALGAYFGGKVSVKQTVAGKGTLTIHFEDDRQMERLLSALAGVE